MLANDNFSNARNIVDEIQNLLFNRLESCYLNDSLQAATIENTIDEHLKLLDQYLDKIEIAANKTSGTQRASIKFKLDQLRYEQKHIQNSYRIIQQKRLNRERENREREELLTRRFITNSEQNAKNNDTQINIGNIQQQQQQEYFDKERQKLNGFNRHVNEIISTGSNVLSTLREQRSMLKNTRKNLLDTLNSIGLSNSVMRLIEKRHIGDKFILFGGMILMTIFMFIIWYFLT